MSNPTISKIGYIGVDILNNATICNETTGLLEKNVPLDLVSVYNIPEPTFFSSKSIELLAGNITHLYPIRFLKMVMEVLLAPFVFRTNFFKAIWKALTGPVEGSKQRFKTIAHLLPAIKLAFYWRSRNIGHIHCQWAHTATTIGMHSAEMLGIGFSFMGHANDLFVHRVALEDKVRRARGIFCISEFHRQFYMDLGAKEEQLQVIYCGISLDRFNKPSQFDPTVKRIASVGRLVEKKGFDDLIRACAILRDRQVEFECLIAGSGPLESSLNQLIKDHRLEGCVKITGTAILQEEIPELIRSSRLFALPCVKDSDGDMDGLPQVLIESMACGVPTVSTFLVGIPDLVRHEENGLLVETRNVQACADAIEKLLEDDLLVQQLGSQAEQWAKAHFGREELTRRVSKFLNWACENPGTSTPPWNFSAAPGSTELYLRPRYERGETDDPAEKEALANC